MIKIGDHNTIMNDRNLFNQIIYTTLPDALRLLNERQKDTELTSKVEGLLNGKIPQIFKDKKCGIMARQLATPNRENRVFISTANKNNLHPVFLEYFDDKFTSNNKYKHSLGQLLIQDESDEKNSKTVEKIKIVDFSKYDGKALKDVKTLWGESLVDFHKKIFKLCGIENFSFFNEIDWYEKHNEKPFDFYKNFFLLITCYGILFENFLWSKDNSESKFTRDVILPALEEVINLTGVKPIIVPIDPFDMEMDSFWYQQLPIVKKLIK